MNVKPVCLCGATMVRKTRKTQSMFDELSYSFDTYV